MKMDPFALFAVINKPTTRLRSEAYLVREPIATRTDDHLRLSLNGEFTLEELKAITVAFDNYMGN